MKKTFREHHLLKILEPFSFAGPPLDVYIGNYFRNNPALGSKDRKYLSENVYHLIRWLSLVDYHCNNSNSWPDRCNALEKLDLEKDLKDQSIPIHVRASFPKSLYTLLLGHFGDNTFELCVACNSQAPTTVRINPIKTSRAALFDRLKANYPISLGKYSEFALHFAERVNFQTLEEFKMGLFEVQDEASQIIANLVDARPGNQVLDFCAGSGGKTLAFAHKLQGKGQIYVHDIREKPLQEAKKRMKRAGIENGQILLSNAPYKKSLKGKFDWVIVDVPCSGTGTLRRNPDLKWKFSLEMLGRLIEEQRNIFKEALEFLSPKGKIVYSTCSLLPEENSQQIEYFKKNYLLQEASEPFHSIPTLGGMDGFFGSVLKKIEN